MGVGMVQMRRGTKVNPKQEDGKSDELTVMCE
jgi:hypothetical protein